MPDDFPRVEVTSRDDVDRVFAQVKRHAARILRKELQTTDRSKTDQNETLSECEGIIDAWIRSAKRRVEPNLSINGMPYQDGSGSTEPFDQVLAQRVQHLAERADTLTADTIKARKTLPSQRAMLLRERHEALRRRDERQEQRRRREEERMAALYSMEDDQRYPMPSLPRAEEVAKTLRTATEDIDARSVDILDQTSAAHEQANFVKRLRIMSASYT